MRLFVCLLVLVAVGCAPRARTTMLGDDIAIVSAKGGAIHDGGDITKAMLKEAAKTGRARGYSYFQVVQAERGTRGAAVVASPTTYFATGGGTVMAIPGPTNAYAIPAGDMTVRFFKEPPDAPNVWNVQSVLSLQ